MAEGRGTASHGSPVVHITVDEKTTLADLLEGFGRTSFQSRNMHRVFKVMESMQTDPSRPLIFLSLAGAMVAGGMKGVIIEMMERNIVDVIVTTGANVAHDVVEAMGYSHYVSSPYEDDSKLRHKGFVRIYDTILHEDGFLKEQELILSLADKLEKRSYSSREFIHELGKEIDDRSSFVSYASKLGIPVFCPALNDSDIGIVLTKHYSDKPIRDRVTIDPIRDNFEIFQIYQKAKKTGVIIVGGGVPRNYVQQASAIEEVVTGKLVSQNPEMGHSYGVLITTDRPEFGGLSGSTISEAVSWGKYSTQASFAEVYCDATIAMPLLVGGLIQKIGNYLKKKPRVKFIWDGDRLVRIDFT